MTILLNPFVTFLKKPVMLGVLLCTSYALTAQSLSSKYEVGLNGGVLIYQGDLTPTATGSFKTLKPVFSIYGTRILNNSFSVRLNLLHGKLKGDDGKYENPSWRQQRNFNFTSPVTEISGLFIWNVMGLRPNDAGIVNFTPYLFAGAGFSFLKIKRDWSNFNYTHFSAEPGIINGLAEDISRSMPKAIPVIPFGIGVRYGISQKLSFTLESAYRITFTDYLDGFSKAANPELRDHYHSHTIGLIYTFGRNSNMDCPVIKN